MSSNTSGPAQRFEGRVEFYRSIGYSEDESRRLARAAWPDEAAAASSARQKFNLAGEDESAERTAIDKSFQDDWHKSAALQRQFFSASIYAWYCRAQLRDLRRMKPMEAIQVIAALIDPPRRPAASQLPRRSASASASKPSSRESTSRPVARQSTADRAAELARAAREMKRECLQRSAARRAGNRSAAVA